MGNLANVDFYNKLKVGIYFKLKLLSWARW